jgi:hypothetical protein
MKIMEIRNSWIVYEIIENSHLFKNVYKIAIP